MFSNLSVSRESQDLTALPEVCQPSLLDVSRLVVTAIKNLKNLTIDKDNYYTSNRIIDIIITLPEEIQNSIFGLNRETFESIKNSIRMENPYIKIKKRITVIDYFVFNLYRKEGDNSNETINAKSLEKFHITRDIWIKKITTHLESLESFSWHSFEILEKKEDEFFKNLKKRNLELASLFKKEEESSRNLDAIISNFSLLTIGSSERKRKRAEAFESYKSAEQDVQQETSNQIDDSEAQNMEDEIEKIQISELKRIKNTNTYEAVMHTGISEQVRELAKKIKKIDEDFFSGLCLAFKKNYSYIQNKYKNFDEVILSEVLNIMWSMDRDAFIHIILEHDYFVKNEKLDDTLPLLLEFEAPLLKLKNPFFKSVTPVTPLLKLEAPLWEDEDQFK